MDIEMLNDYVEAIILNILNKKDSYGYEISKTIIDKVDNKIDIKNATIYLAFKRMEKEGLITSYWNDNPDVARRRYYKITAQGKKYLKDKKADWNKNKSILDKLLLGDK